MSQPFRARVFEHLAPHNRTQEIVDRMEQIHEDLEHAQAIIGARYRENERAAKRLGIPTALYITAIGEGLDNLTKKVFSDSFYLSCILDEAKRQLAAERPAKRRRKVA